MAMSLRNRSKLEQIDSNARKRTKYATQSPRIATGRSHVLNMLGTWKPSGSFKACSDLVWAPAGIMYQRMKMHVAVLARRVTGE